MAQVSRRHEPFCLLFYAVLLLVTLSTIAATYTNYALFPLAFDSLKWSNAWLLASIINYYGAILCFCGVVVASEASWCTAVPWVMACCIVGTPACCLYVFLWLTKEGGSLKLERGSILPLTATTTTTTTCAKPNLSQTSCGSSDTGKTTGSVTDATEVTESRQQQPAVSPATTKATATTGTNSTTQQSRKQQTPHKQQPRHHHQRLDRQLYRNHNHHYQHRHSHRDVERAIIS